MRAIEVDGMSSSGAWLVRSRRPGGMEDIPMPAPRRSRRRPLTRSSAKRSPTRKSGTVYRVLVTLRDTRPAIWRRVLVPGDILLGRLHHVIQAAMGWRESHLHMFHVGGRQFSNPRFRFEDGYDGKVGDEALLTLDRSTLGGKRAIDYEYDLGDPWKHNIGIEKVLGPGEAPRRVPACIAGAGACPPENVGGAPGYEQFLWALAHPNHKEHEHFLEWTGGPFDPERFDLTEADRRVRTACR